MQKELEVSQVALGDKRDVDFTRRQQDKPKADLATLSKTVRLSLLIQT
jgi:hypothetical protein